MLIKTKGEAFKKEKENHPSEKILQVSRKPEHQGCPFPAETFSGLFTLIYLGDRGHRESELME